MTARSFALAVAVASALCSAAKAQDGVESAGLLPDETLLRLVACGAKPGGECQVPIVRWARPEVTLALAKAPDPALETRFRDAIRHAIDQLNGAGAGIRIRMVQGDQADILVRPTTIPEGTMLPDDPGVSSPGIMGVGYMSLWWDDSDHIAQASILMSTEISDADLTSVMLEEIMQSLGFLFDIENPAYEGVSILSQTSNETTTIEGQDAAILRLLYPPP